MTRQSDYIRVSYGRRTEDFPRRCIFIGTTNSSEFLMDHTGNRRWWPIKATSIDIEGLKVVRDQLWAEAVFAFRQGERWHLESDELEAIAHQVQVEKVIIDPWESKIMAFARHRWETQQENIRQSGPNATMQPITTALVLEELNVSIEAQDQKSANRVSRIFTKNGWHKVKRNDPDDIVKEGERKKRIWVFEPMLEREVDRVYDEWSGSGPGMENKPEPQKDAQDQRHARSGLGGPGLSGNNTHTRAHTHAHTYPKTG